MVFALEPRTFRSHDGTRLRYYVDLEPADPARPTLVIAAGLGGGIDAWERVLELLAPRVRVVALDYRGLYGSEPGPSRDAYSIPHHAADVHALLDHEHIARPILVGWSMGVQVNLEVCRLAPSRPAAMIAIHGTFGRPLDTAFGSDAALRAAPHVFELMRRHGSWLREALARIIASPGARGTFIGLCQRLGLMDEALDPGAFARMAEGFASLDLATYADIFAALGAHDASDLLPSVRVPTLVIGGGKDRMSPAHLSERMAREIPGAELCLVERATHFGLLEHPEPIAARIHRFLDERLPLGPRATLGERVRPLPAVSVLST
ncbi:MAG: alpha/beta hydrolase [Myxococcales bacterium]|nr:alpha/beta hydrolase [Myxococcales bacterium]